jgi:hypothetical protein
MTGLIRARYCSLSDRRSSCPRLIESGFVRQTEVGAAGSANRDKAVAITHPQLHEWRPAV